LTAPRIIIGAVYQKLNEDMNFLWTKELRINTVHVKYSFFYLFCRKRGFSSVQMIRDVAAALVLLAQKGKSGEVYNLADKNDTGTARSLSISLLTSQKKTKQKKKKKDQESIAAILREIYGIKTGYQGTIISNFAKLNLAAVTEEINDKHLQPWSEICKAGGISNTPLTPYLDQELLYNNSLSIDGSKIEKLGFVYKHPKVTKDLLVEVIKKFQEVKIWPQ